MTVRVGSLVGAALLVLSLLVVTAPGAEAQPPGPPTPALDVPSDQVEPEERAEVLGVDWRESRDRAWTLSGDGAGLHVLVAEEATGYTWRTAATLSEDGFATDRWIGNACVTADGERLVVAYAPRTFTNEEDLAGRGAFTAVVELGSGAVHKLPVTASLAYFSPSCGGSALTAVLTQEGDTGLPSTRLIELEPRTGELRPPVEVPGQVTSAVSTPDGLVAAAPDGIVRVARDGSLSRVARTDGVPFELHADAEGGVVYMDRRGTTGAVRRIGRQSVQGRTDADARGQLLGSGQVDQIGVSAGAGGRLAVTGEVTPTGTTPPPSVQLIRGTDPRAESSTLGQALVTNVEPATNDLAVTAGDSVAETSVEPRPTQVTLELLDTGQQAEFLVPTAVQSSPIADEPHPALLGGNALAEEGSPSEPVEVERTCSVPRNDPRNQALQPKPRQVEWAVDQAVFGLLNVERRADWNNLQMPAYRPQELFPPIPLLGGGRVPAQVFLGVIAQESNLWQAPGSVVPGVTGSPLIGNYYGQDRAASGNDAWRIRWDLADCGYGVAQVTDGMRLAGRDSPANPALPYQTQRAVALDFAANVAAGLRILQDKWNQTRAAGLTINDGKASSIENWFYALWAYNSGFHPQSDAAQNDGAWGVGWFNNPANPRYPAGRAPFLELTVTDASQPQKWPYPEKVIGFAAHPIELLESPGVFVRAYRQASWLGGPAQGVDNRRAAKPPINQFCDAGNDCVPGGTYVPNAEGVTGERAGPCAHRNSAGQYDLKCWYHEPSTWKSNCPLSCGIEFIRFDPNYPYQIDGTAYPPACDRTGLPPDALVVDDQPSSVRVVRPGCTPPPASVGNFTLDFGRDSEGRFPSKIDFHQLGAGFAGHFWYAHTRLASLRGNSMRVTGTWTLDQPLNQWARVLVHMPDHGAHTQQASYEVDLGNGTVKTRVMLQRTMANRWVSLGVFPFAGTPRVRLSSVTYDGDGGTKPEIENEDIAYDAVAFQPLPNKPRHQIVALGDSYSSGEGASSLDGADYYRETDNNGSNRFAQNSCHRSPHVWSRRVTLAGAPTIPVGVLADTWNHSMDYHLLACSFGVRTEHLLPEYTAPPGPRPINAFDRVGLGMFGELAQLDRGFLDENTTLVTMSVGGNDARFGDILAQCILALIVCPDTTLAGDAEPLRTAEPRIIAEKIVPSLVIVLQQVRLKAPNAAIVLMGYPLLFERGGVCQLGLGQPEAEWLNDMGNLLAEQMSAAVDRAIAEGLGRIRFSDPRQEFAGYAVCGEPEHLLGIVLPTSKTPGERPGLDPPTSQQSFHPTIAGQQLYADALSETLRAAGW